MGSYVFPIDGRNYHDFVPIDFGYEKCRPAHMFGPAIREYYLIHYIRNGKGVFKNKYDTYNLSTGDAFLIRPGEITTYEADKNEPWEYIWIGFLGSMSERFDNLPDVLQLDGTLFEEALHYSSSLFEERLVSMLFRLYCNIFENKTSPNYVNKVIGFINSHYMENVKIEDIASSLNLNRKYLARIFKEQIGMTMQEFLINKRLTQGRIFLKQGYSVGESATLCGYSDTFAFSKAYKKHFGESPKCQKKNRVRA